MNSFEHLRILIDGVETTALLLEPLYSPDKRLIDLSIVEANAGYSPGTYLSAYLPHEVFDGFLSHSQAALQSGQPQEAEFVMPAADGPRWARCRFVPRGSYVVVTWSDVTETRQITETLEQSLVDVELRLIESTRELVMAYEKMRELEKLKDAFLNSVHHELRTPIANLTLYHHLLKLSPNRMEEYLQTLNRETDRLKDIVDKMLEISTIGQEQFSLHMADVHLNDLITQMAERRQAPLEARRITLNFKHSPGLPPIQADRRFMEHVIDVLLGNAIQYTPPGGEIVITTAARSKGPVPGISLAISDSGLGLSESDMRHLFKRFYRGEAAQATKTPGLGLGLAIAKTIVEQHGGLIDAGPNHQGKGTTFTVWLPLS